MKRKIITIDENKCNGCGGCVPGCPEGALQIIDGKARLVNDLFCDGLGACIKECPQGAIRIEEREAEPYDERKVMENIIPKGANTIKAHLAHLDSHGEEKFLSEAIAVLKERGVEVPAYKNVAHHHAGCPGSRERSIKRDDLKVGPNEIGSSGKSELAQWPIQLKLINPNASFFDNADLLFAADCVPFAYPDFHGRFLKGRVLINFCPKLDPYIEEYIEKVAMIFTKHDIKSVSIVRMEVPCCGGIGYVVEEALKKAGKAVMVREYVVSVEGNLV